MMSTFLSIFFWTCKTTLGRGYGGKGSHCPMLLSEIVGFWYLLGTERNGEEEKSYAASDDGTTNNKVKTRMLKWFSLPQQYCVNGKGTTGHEDENGLWTVWEGHSIHISNHCLILYVACVWSVRSCHRIFVMVLPLRWRQLKTMPI